MELSPLYSLIVGVVCVLSLILIFRFHAFIALIFSALLVAFLSDQIEVVEAIPLVTGKFGEMMGGIGLLLILAAIIGKAIMDSGAADRIVRAFTRWFGMGREKYALLFSGFVLSIPVFFDTVYYLLAPLGRAVYARTKKNYALIIACVAGGGVITHALVPPTPGPILVAEIMGISVGFTILIGLLAAIVPMFVGLGYAVIVNRFLHITPSDVIGVTDAEIEEMAAKPDCELPSLWFSMLPFVLPVFLLAALSVFDISILQSFKNLLEENGLTDARELLQPENFELFVGEAGSLLAYSYLAVSIIGDKNIAFMIGVVLAGYLVISSLKIGFKSLFDRFEPAIASGAIIAFITCGGGSFGKTLEAAGIGEFIKNQAESWGIEMIVLAYGTATLIRVAQGSATAAMIITAGVIAPVVTQMQMDPATQLPYHPVYLISVIGFGATGFSWMNDSGFWIFCRMSGITVYQTLAIWTCMLTVISISGFGWVYLLTKILPLV